MEFTLDKKTYQMFNTDAYILCPLRSMNETKDVTVGNEHSEQEQNADTNYLCTYEEFIELQAMAFDAANSPMRSAAKRVLQKTKVEGDYGVLSSTDH